jgi:hypothetical protein
LEQDWVRKADAREEEVTRDAHLDRIASHIAGGGNVGLALSRGTVALDADTAVAVAYLGQALPEAPYQQTHRGGHFLARLPDGLELQNHVGVTLHQGVEADIRGYGSQIVVAPSIHAMGTPYAWKRVLPDAMDELPELSCERAQSARRDHP